MDDYLVATLSASMGAMGDLAGNDFRYSLTWPGRSAVLGTVAAALGVTRDNAAGFAPLDVLSLAVGVHDEGTGFVDFHTVQTVPEAKVKVPRTRSHALAAAGDGVVTTLTHREYRTGVLFTFAIWGEGDLDPLLTALTAPAFTTYMGRKSCPLSAPMAPRLVSAADPVEALRLAQLPPWHQVPLKTVISDPHPGLRSRCIRQIQRHDVPRDRVARTFGQRTVDIVSPGDPA